MSELTRPGQPLEALEQPLSRISTETQRMSDICDLLEAIADDLPRIQAPVWREVARLCAAVIPSHFNDMARGLLPILIRRFEADSAFETVLVQIQSDYFDDMVRLSELSDLLTDTVGAEAMQIDPEALGYALRGFFNVLRRTANWEEEVLLPIASNMLTREDLAELAKALDRPVETSVGRRPTSLDIRLN